MGFFDGLFGGGSKPKRIPLARLDGWIEDRLRSDADAMAEDAGPVAASAGELVARLREDLAGLDASGFNDIDPRYDKIVRTAKPAYVKSMLLAAEGLAAPIGGLDDLRAYEARLGEALDTMGKVSFGDGKFLTFAFRKEMGRVQGDCRKLLDAREKLQGILISDTESAKLSEVKERLNRYLELVGKSKALTEESERLRLEAESARKTAASLESELQALRGSPQYATMMEARGGLSVLEGRVSAMDSKAHMALSPLRSGLRKYEKLLLDKAQAKLTAGLQENPADAYFSAQDGAVEALLEGFVQAVSKGSVSLKDSEKTLRKVESARKELDDGLRREYFSLRDELMKQRMSVQSMPEAAKEDALGREIGSAKEKAARSEAGAKEANEKASHYSEDAGCGLASLKESLKGLALELE
ncbi:MAG: hypothetical protein V1875_06035 [Candidatus Altiarchaeota archaeon]